MKSTLQNPVLVAALIVPEEETHDRPVMHPVLKLGEGQ